jgi:hypothetical protein
MKIAVKDFVNEFVEKKIVMSTKYGQEEFERFLKEKLEITEYLPFNTKRDIVNMIVAKVVTEEGYAKKVHSLEQFLSFFVAMMVAHTNLEFSEHPEEDYDELNRYGLIEPIVAMFQKDYTECEAMLKMAVADELADNNISVVVGKFLNSILDKLDGVLDGVKGATENLDLSKLLGVNMNEEDVAKILGLIDKLNK